MSKVRLSACIMTQDVPELLEVCLRDMDFADEIVIVDGGSDPATKAVATACARAVYIGNPWPGNYSTQRNVYMEAARGEWIFSMDSDERLEPGFAQSMDDWMARDDVDGFAFPRCWRTDENHFVYTEWHYPDFNMRLFRNRPDLRYLDGPENAVHHSMTGVWKPLKFFDAPVIFHDCLIYDDRRTREGKIRLYDEISSNESGARYKPFYLYEDFPHEIRAVADRPPIASLPWIAPIRHLIGW